MISSLGSLMSRIVVAISSRWASEKVAELVGGLAKQLGTEVLIVLQAEDGIRELTVTGVQTCALPICPRVGLALSGGSARGIAHVGVLRALVENGIPIDAISGASAGSLIGGCFAAGLSIERLAESSEERRLGKKRRTRVSPYHYK